MKSSLSSKLRIAVPLILMAIIGIGYVLKTGVGTISAIGWGDVSLLCPLGALGSMIAAKTIVPRALVSLAIVVVLIIIFGRSFCAWICPVPVVSRLRYVFKKSASQKGTKEPSQAVIRAQKVNTDKPSKIDSRHMILLGALLSTAIFGIPVFCLICPIGLSFATILVVILLFAQADLTWSVIFIPVVLLVEVVFFRKWCNKICPMSAFMSIVAKANRTLRPSIDHTSCLESTKGANCGICANVCPEGIDPRHPEKGFSMSECTRCRACVENCPGQAISLPLFAKHSAGSSTSPSPDKE
jgi:ferredoxin-type protein NapH